MMVSGFWFLFGVLAAYLVFTCGAITARYRYEQSKVKAKEPVCGCTHHFAYHDKEGCHFKNEDLYRNETCGCVTYYGPIPATPDMIAPLDGWEGSNDVAD